MSRSSCVAHFVCILSFGVRWATFLDKSEVKPGARGANPSTGVALRSDPSQEGYVPRMVVKEVSQEISEREAAAGCQLPSSFHRSKWIHGKVARADADAILQEGTTGSFFIRESSKVGGYALSFRGPRKIQHFPIEVDEGQRYVCGGRTFDCLEAIVLRYKNEPLMDECKLLRPIPASESKPSVMISGHGSEMYATVQRQGSPTADLLQPPKPVPIYEATRRSTSAADHRPDPGSKPKTQSDGGGEDSYSKMGWIVKKAKRGKRWKPQFFGLRAGKKLLYYFESQHAVKPKGIIDLDTCTLDLADDSLFGRPHCLQLVLYTRCIYLCCDTEADRRDWLNALGRCCRQIGFALVEPDLAASCRIKTLRLSVMDAKKVGVKSGQVYALVAINGLKRARTPNVTCKGESAFFGEDFAFENLADGRS